MILSATCCQCRGVLQAVVTLYSTAPSFSWFFIGSPFIGVEGRDLLITSLYSLHNLLFKAAMSLFSISNFAIGNEGKIIPKSSYAWYLNNISCFTSGDTIA